VATAKKLQYSDLYDMIQHWNVQQMVIKLAGLVYHT